MGRKRKDFGFSEGKQNIIQALIQEYDIKSAGDIQDALKDLLGGTLQNMLTSELEDHLESNSMKDSDYKNSKNGYKGKTLRSKHGKIPIDVPQARISDFEPTIVPKHKRDIFDIEDKIIAMYAKGLSTRQISDHVQDIYGFDVSEGMVSSITNKLIPEIELWQNRVLARVYPIIFIDAIHFSVREDSIVKKLAAYIILGIDKEGRKDVLSIQVGENESSKYWLNILNQLKNRGVEDIFLICADGLTGIKEAIEVAFPKAEYQRCIVHVIRNTLKYVADKDKKELCQDLKTIYHATDEETGYARMLEIKDKWTKKYPSAIKRWDENWDVISPMFKFSLEVRKVIYTTNSIESLNSSYRRLNRGRSVFPNSNALLKALYMATLEITKTWNMPIRNWGLVYGEFSIMYPERLD